MSAPDPLDGPAGAGRPPSPPRDSSVARAVLAFVLAGLLVLGLVGFAGVYVLRRIGTTQALREAEDITAVAARGVVQPRLRNGILKGDSGSLIAIDTLVNGGVLHDPIVRVKIWSPDGRILYSDEPDLIGTRFTLDESARAAFASGRVESRRTDLTRPENRFEQNLGPLLEVTLPVSTPDGHELLFEAELRFDSVAASGRRLWSGFLPVLAVTLVALALLQIPLALRLARRVRTSQQARERLLQRAIASSDMERRRIAADLHDGPIQQLAGLSMSLSAGADRLSGSDAGAAGSLRDAASATRQAMRSLRSALMGIHPQTLQRAGLPAALIDLAAPLADDGVDAEIDVPADLVLPKDIESLLFRASREALRNVSAHARAARVRIRITAGGDRASLEVQDDGVGFSAQDMERAKADGHVGLELLGELVHEVGGELDVRSVPGEGTTLRVEVPVG